MHATKTAIAFLAATATATAASAADLVVLPPPPAPPPVVEAFGGWYLRGDIGATFQRSDEPVNPVLDAVFPPISVEFTRSEWAPSWSIGAGVGYAVNSWLRVDVTGEFRAPSRYRGRDVVVDGFGTFDNEFRARKTEYVGLVNGYLDLGTWSGVTPFVGAGVGVAHVIIDGFTDVNAVRNAFIGAERATRTNFAWALYAGASYRITSQLSFELAYRFLAMGTGRTGETFNRVTGANAVPGDTWSFRNIHSHDVKMGLRFDLQPQAAVVHHGGPLSRAF